MPQSPVNAKPKISLVEKKKLELSCPVLRRLNTNDNGTQQQNQNNKRHTFDNKDLDGVNSLLINRTFQNNTK